MRFFKIFFWQVGFFTFLFLSAEFSAAFKIEEIVNFNFNGFKISEFSIFEENDNFQKMVVQNLSGKTFPTISHIAISYRSGDKLVTRRFLETPYTEPISHGSHATICNNGNPASNGGIVCHYSADLDLPAEISELILQRDGGEKIFHAREFDGQVLFFDPVTGQWGDLAAAKVVAESAENLTAESAGELQISETQIVREDFETEGSSESSVLVTEENNSDEFFFQDVKQHWAKNYICQLAELGAVEGKAPRIFAPDDFISRAEITKIALLAFDFAVPEKVTQKPFWDVQLGTWSTKFIAAAKSNGVINGFVGNIFKPQKFVKRIDALKIILSASGLEISGGEMNFSDLSAGTWFEKFVAFAQSRGIVHGIRGEFQPENFITRAEAAKIVMETLRKKQE